MASKKRGTSPKISVPREDVPIENADLAESEDDLHVIDPSILGQAVVFGTDWTAATLIDQLRRGNIKLDPIFQRRDAWDSRAFFSIITLRRTNSGLYHRLLNKAINYYLDHLEKNHGIKEKNLRTIFLPLGISHVDLDALLVSACNQLRRSEGSLRMQALRHTSK